ncbi:MAG: HlyD family secretion protein [Candidatus Eremiobacteraeota bacterium]|nr:HlyD family secretion protein [Candidatus Eremiobacteraeota bacterium]MBV8374712.1 HlyD family secretion protein [Candidatus Eremiobacteraeota bacterium]
MDTREADQKTVERKTVPQKSANGAAEYAPPAAEEEREQRARPRKRVFLIAGGVVVLILVIVFGIPWLLYALAHQSTDDARVDADVIAVTSKIPERVDRILVDTNQPVRRGQLLIVLDNKDELAKVQQAQAQYDLALANQRTLTQQNRGGVTQASGNVANEQAQVPVAQAGVDQAQAQLQVAASQVPAAQQAFDRAQADYRRTVSLVSTGDEPSQQLDAMRATQAQAAAQLRSSEDQVTAAQASVSAAQERVFASAAGVSAAQGGLVTAQGKLAQSADPSQVEAAKAQLDLAKQNLAYTRIYSATNGYVGEKSVEIGQTVNAGTTLITVIPQTVYITANYKETQMGNMRVGQPVDIHVDAYKGVTFHGHVVSVNPASQNTYALVPAQNATGNFVKVTQRIPVRISIDDQRADMPLRPGMSVETSVKVK